MKALANEIFDIMLDMDFSDYADNQNVELKNLLSDLELLNKQGNGTLLNAIKMLLENQ